MFFAVFPVFVLFPTPGPGNCRDNATRVAWYVN